MRPTNANYVKLFAALTPAFAGLWVMLDAINAVNWSDEEVALVSATSTASLALVLAVLAHFKKTTTPEPVSMAVAGYAEVNSIILLLVGFQYVHWTDAQIGIVLSFVNLALAVPAALWARSQVSPVQPVVSSNPTNSVGSTYQVSEQYPPPPR